MQKKSLFSNEIFEKLSLAEERESIWEKLVDFFHQKYVQKALLSFVLVLALLMVHFLAITTQNFVHRYERKERQAVLQLNNINPEELDVNKTFRLTTYHLNQGLLSATQKLPFSFGNETQFLPLEKVKENLDGSIQLLRESQSDFFFLQGIEVNSHRTYQLNFLDYLSKHFSVGFAFAYTQKTTHYPWLSLALGEGQSLQSGMATFSPFAIEKTEGISLENDKAWWDFSSWQAEKATLLRSEFFLPNTERKLVLLQFFLPASLSEDAFATALKRLGTVFEEEKKQGHLVLAGGNFGKPLANIENRLHYGEKELLSLIFAENRTDIKTAFAEQGNTAREKFSPYVAGQSATYIEDAFFFTSGVEVQACRVLSTTFSYSANEVLQVEFQLKP